MSHNSAALSSKNEALLGFAIGLPELIALIVNTVIKAGL